MTHAELVKRAATWLRNHGAVVVATEVVAWHCPESPDVVGWTYAGQSMLVEVKVSRSDFLADRNKAHRRLSTMGVGNFRYYAAPRGIIEKHELPAGWGLIECSGGGMRQVAAATAQEAHDMREKVLLVQMMRYSWTEYTGKHWRTRHNVDVEPLAEEGGS